MHFLNEETQFEFNPKTQILNLRPFTSTPTRLAFITWPNIVIYYHLGISFAIVLTQNLHRLRMKPFMEIDASTITQIKSARGTKIHAKMEGNAGIMFCLHTYLTKVELTSNPASRHALWHKFSILFPGNIIFEFWNYFFMIFSDKMSLRYYYWILL